jgi:hypothetical protein
MLKLFIAPAGALDMANTKGTVEGEPIFYGDGRDACNVAVVKLMDGDAVVRLGIIKLYGADLRLAIVDRTAPALSKYEQKRKKKEEKAK